jgi:excisionase family DNA binding protein
VVDLKVVQSEGNASVDESRVMTLRAVAAYLNCHVSTIYRLVKAGQLPAFRLGIGDSRGEWRFLRSDIDAWITGRLERPRPHTSGKRGKRGKPGPKTKGRAAEL